MSAINPVIQTPPRLNSDQFNSEAGQTSTPAAERAFSDTLNSVGAKPVRKSTFNKGQNSNGSGGNLPANGNSSPQPVTPAAANPAAAPTGANVGSAPAAPANPAGSAATATAAAAAVATAAPATGGAGAVVGSNPAAAPPEVAAAAAGSAAALESSGAQSSLPGHMGEAPQSAGTLPTVPTPDAPPATAVTPSSDGAAKPAMSTPSNWIAGRNATAMRAINPTGDNAGVAAGKSTQGGQDTNSVPAPDASSTAAVPATQVDTAALMGAIQASPAVSTAAANDAAPAAPAGNPSDPIADPLGLAAANGDVPSALPAMAAAAASAAQVVSTIAANVAADKKSHADSTEGPSASTASSTADAAGAAQLLNTQGPPHTDANAVPTFRVNAPVDSPEFSQNVANHVSTMFDSNVNTAKLQVNPPALGPIEVRIAIQGDHAQVWMASHSAMTRDALQEAAPKLREMLNSQGFAQVSVDISQRSFQERTPTAHAYEWNREPSAASNSAVSTAASITRRAPSGTLDAYA